MISQWVFWIGFSCLIIHELDAIEKKEWKLFPVLRSLPDSLAFRWFTGLHLPLLAFFLFKLSASPSQQATMSGFSVFFLLHLVAHLVLWSLPDNRFNNWFSQLWIWGAAVCGALYLFL